MSAIGSLHFALAANNVVTHFNNTDINVQTNTNQKQECDTAGGSSGITNSCTATSTDMVTQSGDIHYK